jgi:anti-sigma regulatory factor (Ser/Thr protein kinase)
VFRGQRRELSALRRWLSSLLPECPSRDDVLSVATELASNAVLHTASGQGGWFAVEVSLHRQAVVVAVADCGGSSEPHVIDDPAGEHGRGLMLVRNLSARTGYTGDQHGRLVWAQVPWDHSPPAPGTARDPYLELVRNGEAALACRFAGVPAWFGRSTLAWWAAGPQGLVSAPSAQELARLLDDSPSPHPALARAPARQGAAGQHASQAGQKAEAGSRPTGPGMRRYPGTAATGRTSGPGFRATRARSRSLVPLLVRPAGSKSLSCA